MMEHQGGAGAQEWLCDGSMKPPDPQMMAMLILQFAATTKMKKKMKTPQARDGAGAQEWLGKANAKPPDPDTMKLMPQMFAAMMVKWGAEAWAANSNATPPKQHFARSENKNNPLDDGVKGRLDPPIECRSVLGYTRNEYIPERALELAAESCCVAGSWAVATDDVAWPQQQLARAKAF